MFHIANLFKETNPKKDSQSISMPVTEKQSVADIVKTTATSAERAKHVLCVDSVIETQRLMSLPPEVVDKLVAEGFIWFIDEKFVAKFRHTASIRGGWKSGVYADEYAGDIPDFAIERIKEAVNCGIQVITIHSSEPMPIRMQHIDPVVIGWLQRPGITNDGELERKSVNGVVIAAWDLDLEPAL